MKSLFTVMKKQNLSRKYFAAGSMDGVATLKKGYLLRWYCDATNQVLAEGPYGNHDKAIAEQNEKLINGVCSWLVPYGG